MKVEDKHIEPRLIDFAYGELSTSEATVIQRHLDRCAACSKAFSELQAVRRVMSRLPVEPAPDRGVESILMYAKKVAQPRKGFRFSPIRWAGPIGLAVAIALVVVVAVRVDQTGRIKLAPASESESLEQAQEQRPTPQREDPLASAGAISPSPTGALAPEERERSVRTVDEPEPSEGSGSAPKMKSKTSRSFAKEELRTQSGSGVVAGYIGPAGRAADVGEKMESPEDTPRPSASKPGMAGAPRRAVMQADPVAVLSERAARAKRSGDRIGESRYLRQAVVAANSREEILVLLAKLCESQRDLGSDQGVRESCGRIVRDFPGTEAARSAEEVLKRFTLRSPPPAQSTSEPGPKQ